MYKLGFGYYVLDGHHRVAVALTQGQVEIDANVIEYVAVADAQAPERFAARRAFERATGLTEVGAARPETYGILLDAIEHYKQEQGLDEMERAARRWFASYGPAIRACASCTCRDTTTMRSFARACRKTW